MSILSSLKGKFFKQKNAFNYAYEGEKMLLSKQYKKALNLYNKAIPLAKADDDKFIDMYYSSRAVIRKQLKDFDGALQDINIAINMKQGIYLYYFERSSIKECMQDKKGAEEDLAKVFSILENNGSEHSFKLYLAAKKVQNKDYAGAAEILKDTDDDIRYNNERAYTLKAEIYSNIGDDDKLINILDKLTELFPRRTVYLQHKADILMQQKKYDEALKAIETALSIEPDNAMFADKKELVSEIIYDRDNFI